MVHIAAKTSKKKNFVTSRRWATSPEPSGLIEEYPVVLHRDLIMRLAHRVTTG